MWWLPEAQYAKQLQPCRSHGFHQHRLLLAKLLVLPLLYDPPGAVPWLHL
jgi:hypothetical protein